MKKLFIYLLLGTLPLSLIAQQKGIQFEKGTLTDALAKGAKENKNVFIDCYTQWCGPCRYMSNNVLNTDSVGEYMNPRFVSLKLDMERGEGLALSEKYNIKVFPTFMILNPAAKELGRVEGSASASQFIQYIGMAAEGKDVNEFRRAEREKEANVRVEDVAQEKDTIYDEGKGIDFLNITYAEALQKAKTENKRIFIDCYTSWCAPCRVMLNTTFKDTRIGNLMNYQFICLKINMEEEGDGKMLFDKFNVKVFPTYLLINPDGSEYNRFIASGSVLDFADNLKKALLGEEDQYTKMMREQKEQIDKARASRKSNLKEEPKQFSPSLVKFENNLNIENAIKKAKKQNKNVFVMLYAECWPADYMLETVFNEDAAADYLNKNFINLLVDAESVLGDNMMEKYDLEENFPGYLIIDSEGKVKATSAGHRKKADIFVNELESLLSKKQ